MRADFLTDDEFRVIANGLAKLGRVIIASSTENNCADIVDNALAHSKNMVDSRKWTVAIARDYCAALTNAAAAYYAMRRSISEYEVRNLLVDILYSIAGIINDRIGFALLPTNP